MTEKNQSKIKKLFAKKGVKTLSVTVATVIIIGVLILTAILEGTPSKISVDQAQSTIDTAYNDLLNSIKTDSSEYIISKSDAKVKEVSYGSNNEIYAKCEITSINTYETLQGHLDSLYEFKSVDENNMPIVSTKLKYIIDDKVYEYLSQEAKTVTGTYEITICDTADGLKVYTNAEMINNCFGDLYKLQNEIKSNDSIESNHKNAIVSSIDLNYSVTRPETATGILKLWNSFKNEFQRNFLNDNLWQYILSGLKITLEVSCFAVLIGVVLGFITAIIRCTHDKTGKLRFLNKIAQLYLTVFRGTPVVVQLMIIYFVWFMPLGINQVLAAIICFGVNSGSYVCEIVRGGIMAIDEGQMEAGRSLGFNYVKTMWYIVIPQAFKAVLPALANEFIVLLKETSVVGYIGLNDLTRGGDIIKSITYSAFMPLIIVAIIYLAMVVILTKLVGLLEKRLRNSER